jgi:hypothetical protein
MKVYLVFTFLGIAMVSLFDPGEPRDWSWPAILLLVAGHFSARRPDCAKSAPDSTA